VTIAAAWLPPELDRSSLLLDSNPLLLLAVGSYDRKLIATVKRVSGYTVEDYEVLGRFASGFRDVATTPHILTEVSNLANSLPYYEKQGWFDDFARRIAEMKERNITAIQLAKTEAYSFFGLTDAALFVLAASTLVATADDRLCDYLRRNGLLAVSFREIRAICSDK
jgi:hypothetical protein